MIMRRVSSIPPVLVVRGEAVDHNGHGEGDILPVLVVRGEAVDHDGYEQGENPTCSCSKRQSCRPQWV